MGIFTWLSITIWIIGMPISYHIMVINKWKDEDDAVMMAFFWPFFILIGLVISPFLIMACLMQTPKLLYFLVKKLSKLINKKERIINKEKKLLKEKLIRDEKYEITYPHRPCTLIGNLSDILALQTEDEVKMWRLFTNKEASLINAYQNDRVEEIKIDKITGIKYIKTKNIIISSDMHIDWTEDNYWENVQC